MSVLSPQ
ncbi:rCG21193, isoform CRA_b [Rattus norvegicus]|nr:rCG21193, isoform CRA_b [Rattus norvegicus]